jgi:hypothetical protein
VLRERSLRAWFGPGTLYLNGIPLGVVTSYSYGFGSAFQELPMTFEPIKTKTLTRAE